MAEDFKVIETQEQFDSAIKARLERERNKFTEQLADFESTKTALSEAQKQVNDLTNALNSANDKIKSHADEVAEKDSKIAAYELASVKTKVAHEMGLSFDAINFLQGKDEDSIRKSAESLKALVGTNNAPVAPLASPEPAIQSADGLRQSDLKSILSNLRGE